MKLLANASVLAKAITPAVSIAPAKAVNEVMRNIVVDVRDNALFVTGSDLTVTVVCRIEDVEAIEDGAILVDGTALLKVLKGLGDSEVELSIGKGLRCDIKAPNAYFKVAGEDIEAYPDPRSWSGKADFLITACHLIDMVDKVHPSAHTEHGRFSMNGIRLEITKKRMRVVATDSRRLSLCERRVDSVGEKMGVTVPKAGLLLLERLVDSDETLEVQFDDLHLHFRGDNAEIILRLVAGDYPPYGDVIPKDSEIKIRLERKEWLKTLKKSTILTTKSTKAARFSFEEGGISISAYEDRGEMEAHVLHPVDYEGEEMVMGFNPYHFIAGVQCLESSEFDLELNAPDNVAMIREQGDYGSFVHLLVPVSLSR